MNHEIRDHDRLHRLSWPSQAAIVTLSMMLVYALLVPVSYGWAGSMGLRAAALAAGACVAGAVPALLVGRLFSGPTGILCGMLAGMALRTGIPLAAALAVRLRGQALTQAGFFYYLIVFFLIGLGIETMLLLPAPVNPRRLSGS